MYLYSYLCSYIADGLADLWKKGKEKYNQLPNKEMEFNTKKTNAPENQTIIHTLLQLETETPGSVAALAKGSGEEPSLRRRESTTRCESAMGCGTEISLRESTRGYSYS